jgi:hypothetical protein
VLELLDSSPGSSRVALVAVLVDVLVEVFLARACLVGFSAAASLVVRAAVLVDGVGTLGSDPVATSAGVPLVMPGRLMTAYVSHSSGRIVAVGSENSEKNVSKVGRWRVRETTHWLSTASGLESHRRAPCGSAATVVRGVLGDTYRRRKSGPRYFDVLIFRSTKLHKSHE